MCLHPSPKHYFTVYLSVFVCVCMCGHVPILDAHSLIYGWINAAARVAVNNLQAIRKGWTTVAGEIHCRLRHVDVCARTTLIPCIHTHRYIDRWSDGQTQAVKHSNPSSFTQPGELMWFHSHLESDTLPEQSAYCRNPLLPPNAEMIGTLM